MAKTKKYSIDMVRLSLGESQGFVYSEEFMACRERGRFVSGRFDGGGKNSEWGRLRINIKTSGYCAYKISVYASDNRAKPSDQDWENKNSRQSVENFPELLLNTIAGRYLWFSLDVQGDARVYGGALYTSGEAFEDYLPQMYNICRESFSHRYLSIFFTAYSELSENINDFGNNLDVHNAPDSFLPFIAQLLGLDGLCGILSPSELRLFLSQGRYLSRYRGTRRAVLSIAELLTGKKPVLLDQMKIHENTAAPYIKTYGRLYGEKHHIIILIFFNPMDGDICMRLQRLTDMFMPLDGTSRIVVKQSSVILDGYTYLDYNARFMPESGGRASGVKSDEGFALL